MESNPLLRVPVDYFAVARASILQEGTQTRSPAFQISIFLPNQMHLHPKVAREAKFCTCLLFLCVGRQWSVCCVADLSERAAATAAERADVQRLGPPRVKPTNVLLDREQLGAPA